MGHNLTMLDTGSFGMTNVAYTVERTIPFGMTNVVYPEYAKGMLDGTAAENPVNPFHPVKKSQFPSKQHL